MKDNGKARGRRVGSAGTITTADLIVLSFLEERPMHGYDLLAEYDRQEVVDWASVSKAQVYYALRKLDSQNLIIGRIEEHGARDRTVYQLTDEGRKALNAALNTETWANSRVPQPFTTWFGLSIHLSKQEQLDMLIARRDFLVKELNRERESLEFIKTLDNDRGKKGDSVVSLVIMQIEVEITWVNNILEGFGFN